MMCVILGLKKAGGYEAATMPKGSKELVGGLRNELIATCAYSYSLMMRFKALTGEVAPNGWMCAMKIEMRGTTG